MPADAPVERPEDVEATGVEDEEDEEEVEDTAAAPAVLVDEEAVDVCSVAGLVSDLGGRLGVVAYHLFERCCLRCYCCYLTMCLMKNWRK